MGTRVSLSVSIMDSITQAALGAAVAELGMGGKRLGNKAILWGVGLGTLPDLDVLVHPWLGSIQRLEWHRGISHSLVFMVVASPLIGWLISRIQRGDVSVVRAAWTTFAIFFTHVLIDVFTVYGTMIFEPFSDRRVGFNNLFIIDPLFTLPLLAGLIAAGFCRRNLARRQFWNSAGLAISTLYVIWSFGAKATADAHFAASMREQGISYNRRMTAPTPFNTLLWRSLAATDDGCWIGYWSLLDRRRPVEFDFIPRNDALLEGIADTRAVQRLIWFSNGYYGVEKRGDHIVISDWRFGEVRPNSGPISEENFPQSIFAWRLTYTHGELLPMGVRVTVNRRQWLQTLMHRLIGVNSE